MFNINLQPHTPARHLAHTIPPAPVPTSASVWLTASIEDGTSGKSGVTDRAFIRALNGIGVVDELHIWIDSNGGDCRAMTKMMAAIHNHPATIKVTHAVGKVFSAAAAIFLLGDRRLMTPDSCLMLHPASSAGDDTVANAMAYSDVIRDLFALRAPGVNLDTLREWQHRETYLDAAHCWRLGLATGLDLQAQARVAVDASRCSQPVAVSDFSATRKFDANLARKKAAPIPTPIPKPTPAPKPGPTVRDVSQREPVTVECPPMPATLRGRCIGSSADILALVTRHAQVSASAEPEDAYSRWQRQEDLRIMAMMARAQARIPATQNAILESARAMVVAEGRL